MADDCDDCGLGEPALPPAGPRVRLTGAEYLLYAAGQRDGHADALANEAANMERLAKWFVDGVHSQGRAAGMLMEHSVKARTHSRDARADSARMLDQVEGSRWRWLRGVAARIRAAWRALRLGAPTDAV